MTTDLLIQLKRLVGLCFAATFGLLSCSTQNQAINPDSVVTSSRAARGHQSSCSFSSLQRAQMPF